MALPRFEFRFRLSPTRNTSSAAVPFLSPSVRLDIPFSLHTVPSTDKEL